MSTSTFTTCDPCTLPFAPHLRIQGQRWQPCTWPARRTHGVVVGDFEGPAPALRGFYIQDPAGDGNAATSDGLFVFNGNSDSVSLATTCASPARVGEFQGQTQVSAALGRRCGTGTIAPVDVTLPFPARLRRRAELPERYEGMLVRLPQTLDVTEHFQLGRFGQVVRVLRRTSAAADERDRARRAGAALQAQNKLNRLIIDDALNNQNPDPIVFGRGGQPLSAANTLRGGDTATGIVGVMTYTWAGNAASGNAFRVRPIGALDGFVRSSPPTRARRPRPTSAGTLRVAGMNLLNYFNTFDGASSNPPFACSSAWAARRPIAVAPTMRPSSIGSGPRPSRRSSRPGRCHWRHRDRERRLRARQRARVPRRPAECGQRAGNLRVCRCGR